MRWRIKKGNIQGRKRKRARRVKKKGRKIERREGLMAEGWLDGWEVEGTSVFKSILDQKLLT